MQIRLTALAPGRKIPVTVKCAQLCKSLAVARRDGEHRQMVWNRKHAGSLLKHTF